MSSSARKIARLLGFLVFALPINSPATAQSCQDQLHAKALHQLKASVSVASLQIPAKAWEHFEKARHASETGNPELFDRETNLALRADPNFAEVYILRAASQVLARHYDEAIASVAQARLIQPGISWAGIILTSALTGLHRYDDAIAETERIHGPDAVTWQWAFERTRAEIGRGDAINALHYSELALATGPAGCADTHLLRANALQIAGRKADAVLEFQTYLDTPGPPESARAQVQRVLDLTRKRLGAETGELLAAN